MKLSAEKPAGTGWRCWKTATMAGASTIATSNYPYEEWQRKSSVDATLADAILAPRRQQRPYKINLRRIQCENSRQS